MANQEIANNFPTPRHGPKKSAWFIAFLALAVPLVTASAQAQHARTPKYVPPTNCTTDPTLPKSTKLACEQIEDSLTQFSEKGGDLGEKVRALMNELPRRTVTKEGRQFEGIPMENPLDSNDGNEGGDAWEEYSHDSKLALHSETFMGCLEPRLVPVGPYEGLCQQLCPSPIIVAPGCPRCLPGTPGCVEQTHMVIEYYLPMYEVATNKAGARSIDVAMFNGYDNQPKLTRSQTSQHHEDSVKQGVEESIRELSAGQSANGNPSNRPKWPNYHRPGKELFLQGNHESFNLAEGAESFPIAYQTLLHAHASRDRPLTFYKGWAEEPKSALWCFGPPEKKVIANAMDHGDGIYSLLSRMAEFTEVAWPEAYRATVNLPWNLQQTGTRETLPQELAPSYRMQRWGEPFEELSRVGIQPGGSSEQRDWIFYGGTLAPFIQARFNTFTDPVRADLFRMTSAALLFGSRRGSLSVANSPLQRLPQFSLYTGRHGGGRAGYSGDQDGIEDSIVFTDKIQLAYPPLKDGGTRKGSQCFRIENLANSEPGGQDDLEKTKSGHLAPPKNLRVQFLDGGLKNLNRANETRMLVWTKRVMCACERCGIPYGCNTLNHGDFREDAFAGSFGFPTPPPPLAAVKPFLDGYARKTSPPPVKPPVAELFDIPASDLGTPGANPGFAPPGFAQQPSPPNSPPPQIPPPVPPQLIACLLQQSGLAKARFSKTSGQTLQRDANKHEVAFYQSTEIWKPVHNPKQLLLAQPIAFGRNCGVSGCSEYRIASSNRFNLSQGVFTPPTGSRLCQVSGGGMLNCGNPVSSPSSRSAGSVFKVVRGERLARGIGDLLGAGNPAALAPTASGLAPITAAGGYGGYGGYGSVNAATFTNNFGTFGGNLQTAVANAAQSFGGVTSHLSTLQNQFASSISNIQASVDQLFSNTLGAGQNVGQAVNNIRGELNQIAHDIRSSNLKWADKQELLHQKHQLEQQLEELEEEIDEDEEDKQQNNQQQQCGGGELAGQVVQALTQALGSLLSGGGGGGAGNNQAQATEELNDGLSQNDQSESSEDDALASQPEVEPAEEQESETEETLEESESASAEPHKDVVSEGSEFGEKKGSGFRF